MSTHVEERYRAETRRLVATRGPLGAMFFAGGVGIAGALESYYHPERLVYALLFLSLELAICLATMACYRMRRLRRYGVALTRTACIALVVCVTVYGALAGTNRAALAFLFIVFELGAALVFPWGPRSQGLTAFACVLAEGVHVGVAGADGALPVAYELYAVAAGGLLSILGAAFLDRQRFTVFVQREQLDQHLAMFRDLTRLHGLDPLRVIFLACTSTLQTFGLRRLWMVWRAPGSGDVQGYLVRAEGARVTWQPLADGGPLWAWITRWDDSAPAFLVPSTDAHLPAVLRGARVGPMLCVPLGEGESRLGAICADRDGAPLALGERELDLASMVACGAAIAMANAWLFQQVAAASEEKSVFLARIAHELRNPLQAVLWDVDMLRDAAPTPQPQLERLRQNALMTLDLAKELQEFAEIETRRLALAPEPINLAQTLDQLQAMVMPLLEGRPITFRTVVGEGAEVVVTDPFRLRQILTNLISNAAKFTARGTIGLEARRIGDDVVIRVRDTGAGIEPAELARIFVPFYRGSARAHGPGRGMGLGLAIAHELATLLGGRLEVESTPARGSTFSLMLPAGELPVPAPLEEPALAPGTVVLVIEDDRVCRAASAAALRRRGATVVEAGEGFEGLRRARARRPDVIVLDLGLPGLGGLEVLAHLKRDRILAAVPVVVATAEVDAQLEARCREAGCAAYLRKPLAGEDLLRVVAGLTGGPLPHPGRATIRR